MTDTVSIIISTIAALGIGGILGGYVRSWSEHRREIKEHEHQLKQTRYGCILILMLTQLNPEEGLIKAKQFRQDLKNADDVKKEIETELLNAVVFAGDEVISSLSEFIRNPDYSAFVRVAIAMRRDLWGKKTKVNETLLDGIFKKAGNN